MLRYNEIYPGIRSLIGKTIKSMKVSIDDGFIRIDTTDGMSYKIKHEQECCEHVYISSEAGSIDDLIGQQIVDAMKFDLRLDTAPGDDIEQETRVVLYSKKGFYSTVWFGQSNGYYGVEPDLIRAK